MEAKLRKDGRPRKKPGPKLSPVKKEALLKARDEILQNMEALKADNAFWFFEPSSGIISEDRKHFLRKHIREEDIPQRLDSQLDILLSTATTIGAWGGNQCLGGETEIYNPVNNTYTRVDQIHDDFYVLAWDGEKLVVAEAIKPFIKPLDSLYNFELSNGQSFVASMSHLVLTRKGYLSLTAVVSEGLPFLQVTNLGIYPLVHAGDGQSSLKIAQDYQDDCLAYHHSYGEQPLLNRGSGLSVVPLSNDVHTHTEQAFSHGGDRECTQECSHSYLPSGLLSNQDGLHHHEGHDADFEYHNACKPYEPSYQTHQDVHQLHDASNHQPLSIGGVVLQAKRNDILSSPCASSLVTELVVTNVTYIRDDVKWDFTVPVYHNYYLAGAIHHNSGKSSIAAVKRFIDTTGEVPLSLKSIYPAERLRTDFSYCEKVRIVGVDHKTMLNTLIPTYQKWCPREYLKNGKWSDSFSSTQNTLFLYKKEFAHPIASFEFMTNQQDVESFQGPPIHRIVYDEEPREAIRKENLMRFVTAGKVDEIFSMTPTNGISWATDLFENEAGDDGIEKFKLVSLTNKKANLIALEEVVKGISSYEEKKMRLLGDVISLSGLVYGKLFDRTVHIIQPFFEDLNEVEKKDYLCLTGLDPHLVTPTAMVFALLDREGNTYIDRCWHNEGDTEEIKAAWWDVVKGAGYRHGWAVADKSSNSSIMAFGGRNIYMELSRGKGAIPALRTSEKFEGSIKAGVDEIKRRLKFEEGGKPRFFIVDRPENKQLIQSFRTLERDTYANEDSKGLKDRINEGRHHLHAAMRYVFQFNLNWYPVQDEVPLPDMVDDVVCW